MTTLQFFSTHAQRMRAIKLSDHEPVIEQDVVSWNIMMQGRFNAEKNRYNNGLELIETQGQYQQRLQGIASAIADICTKNAQIQVLCLQEAPIVKADIEFFADCCLRYESLQKFEKTLRDDTMVTRWGLMALFAEHYTYKPKPFESAGLEDRIQKFKLTDSLTGTKRMIINLHLPFDMGKQDPGALANEVVRLVPKPKEGAKKEVMIAGDFNFLVTKFAALHKLGSITAPANNSTETHSKDGGFNTLENVDAIIRVKIHRDK